MRGNRLLTETLRQCSPATSRLVALIREKIDHHRRWKSVHGSTSRLPCTFLATHTSGRVPRLYAGALSATFPSNAIPAPLSDVLRSPATRLGNRYCSSRQLVLS